LPHRAAAALVLFLHQNSRKNRVPNTGQQCPSNFSSFFIAPPPSPPPHPPPPPPPLAAQTPANEASSAVASKSHAHFQYNMRPPRASFSILAGKSLHISYFVELRADIALSTGLIHRIPGVISCCFRTAHVYLAPFLCISCASSGAGGQQHYEGAGAAAARRSCSLKLSYSPSPQ
jgi:hypothetical protein